MSVNRLVIAGVVVKVPRASVSPGGVSLVRFTLEHFSRQHEAGAERDARCRIGVVAMGGALHAKANALSEGDQVQVTGFLTRSSYRTGEVRLMLHASAIDPVSTE